MPRPGVHHERPVLRDRLADRPALQQQHLDPAVAGRRARTGSSHAHDRAGAGARSSCPPIAHARPRNKYSVRTVSGPVARRAASTSRRRPCARPDRDVGVGARRPRVRRRRRGRGARRAAPATTVTSVARPASSSWCDVRDVVAPQHREVRLDHLVGGRQVQPDLEQLERVRAASGRAAGTSRSARCRARRSATARRRARSARSRRASRSGR